MKHATAKQHPRTDVRTEKNDPAGPIHPDRTPVVPERPKAPIRTPPKPIKAERVAAAADVLSRSERTVVLVGVRASTETISRRVTALAELVDLPVVSTLRGKGVLSDRSPRSLFALAQPPFRPHRDLFSEADTVLTIGLDPSEGSIGAWYQPHHQVIRIDTPGSEKISDEFPAIVSLEGNIPNIIRSVGNRLTPHSSGRNAEAWYSQVRERLLADVKSVRIRDSMPPNTREALYLARLMMPDDAVLAADTSSRLEDALVDFPTYNVKGIVVGSDQRRSAISTATVAALADPDRVVVAAVTDETASVHEREISLAAELGAHVVVLDFTLAETASDAALAARAHAVPATRASDVGEFRDAFSAAVSRTPLSVIDIPQA